MEVCSIDGCNRKIRRRGLCKGHWTRWKTFGDPNAGKPLRGTLAECSDDRCTDIAKLKGRCVKHHKAWEYRQKNPIVYRHQQPEQCIADGCDKKPKTNNVCNRHYYRLLTYGDPNFVKEEHLVDLNTYELFLKHTNKNGPVPDHDPSLGQCWIWTAGAAGDGGRYGGIHVREINKRVLVHRYSYAKHNDGELADTVDIDHQCFNTKCVNPNHLRPVTHKQNMENIRLNSKNTTGARGVWKTGAGRFAVEMKHHGKKIWGGVYKTVEEADRASRALRDQYFTHHQDGTNGTL